MKSFLDHLKEEVLPSVQVADGGLDIDKPAVRAAINAALASVTSQPAVTPYVVFNRLSKLLAQYHIILPRRFLEGDKGVEVFELRQFGHRMGMTDSGEFVSDVPTTHYLFLQYGIITPFGVTYAKPVVGGMFRVMARLVDKAELDKLIDMAEITMSEEAECMQAIAKANAPKDPMHDITSDPKKVGNKKAVGTSEKKSLEEKNDLANACKPGYKAYGLKKKGSRMVPNCAPVEEQQIDELYGKGSLGKIKAHHDTQSKKETKRGEAFSDTITHGKPSKYRKFVMWPKSKKDELEGKLSSAERKSEYHQSQSNRAKMMMKKEETQIDEATDKDRELSKIASKAISKGHPVKKLSSGRAENAVLPRGMAKGINLEKGRWSGHGRFNEEIDSRKMLQDLRDVDAKANPNGPAAYRKKEEDDALERAGKDYYNNMKESQLDELDIETHKRYKTAAKADRDVKKKIVKKANKGLYLLPHDEGKFERDVKKRKSGIKMVKKKLVKEEVHVKSWSDGTHTAKINRGEGKPPHVISRKSEKDLHNEILSRYPALKGKIPRATPVTPVKEEKGDRVVPGSLSPELQKQVQDLSRDVSSGERGATFALKGNPAKTINVTSDAPERGNKVGTRAPLNEKAPPGREKQVLALKKKFPKGSGSPFAIAWSSYKKSKKDQVEESKNAKGTVLITPRHPSKEEKKHIKGGGGVQRILKSKYDPKKHNLASE